ncbi:MAG: DUF4388 domain-containing protein [Cyanobacteria bacterium REEB67]|nr:DUF4388 domain-containing protein [Cyanobacteria bacterium REEB67]
MNSTELSRHANSLGLIFDQGDIDGTPLGSAWLVDPHTVVTCAHNVILYKDHLVALKVRFPISGKELAVRSVYFHPKLDQKHLIATAKRALGEPLIALALTQNNVAVLKVGPGLQPLNPVENKELNEIFKADRGPSESGLGGNLAEIELALVLQTITNARKEGTVTLIDTRGRVNGRLFCKQGRVSHAYYKNLVNEMAVNQIIEHKLAGGFYFTSEGEPDWTSVAEINRPTDSLLIEAHRRLDELDKLAGIVGGPSSLFERLTPEPRLDALPVDCREFAKLIWPLLDGGTPLGFMWELCGIDDYSVYMTLQELIKTRQISYFEAPFVKAAPPVPIQLGVQTPLNVGDEIAALWVDNPSMAPLVRTGTILGSLTEFDPAHVIHTVGLPSSASGAPLVKDEVVIGMHCGALPPDSSIGPTQGFHQMIWVDSIAECLSQAGEKELVKKLTASDMPIPVPGQAQKSPGCREVARIQCPKCGRSTLELTNFCKGCGGRLLKDQTPGPKRKVKPLGSATAARLAAVPSASAEPVKGPSLILAFIMALIGLIGGLGALALIPQPNVINGGAVTIPHTRWIEPSLLIRESLGVWRQAADDRTFTNDDEVCVGVHTNNAGYVYCLLRGTSGATALVYPPAPPNGQAVIDNPVDVGARFSIGCNGLQDRTSNDFKGFKFDLKPGQEKVILVGSTARGTFCDSLEAQGAFVDRALQLLAENNSPQGIQTTVEQFGSEFFKAGQAKVGNDKTFVHDPVYLSLVVMDHILSKKATIPR